MRRESGKSSSSKAWRRFKKNRAACAGLVLIALLFTVAAFAPVLAPYRPDAMDLERGYSPSAWKNWLGTDEFGRDVLSRIIYGARVVVLVAIGATAVATFIGIMLGSIAGFYGGIVDTIIMRTLDVLLAFPPFVLAVGLVAFLGTGAVNVVLVVGLTRIPRFARIIRGTVLSIKEKEYVEASRAMGLTEFRNLIAHVLPNCIGPTLVYASLTLGDSILTISGLSFLGLGLEVTTPEWGAMLTRGREYLMLAPWLALYPGMAIFLTVMAFNLLGDGLRDALDPQG